MTDTTNTDPNGLWLVRQLSSREKTTLTVHCLVGIFILGVVTYKETTVGPVSGAAIMVACALLIIGMGFFGALVSVVRRRGTPKDMSSQRLRTEMTPKRDRTTQWCGPAYRVPHTGSVMQEAPTETRPDEESLLKDARARIIWGEPPEEVADSLLASGVDRWHVDQEIKRFKRERAAAIRTEGITEMWKGVGFFLAGALPIVGIYMAGYVIMKLFAICAVASIYGAYRFIHGLDLTLTGWMRGSIS